ncbi:MAG: VanW family protein [Lachnospiraceae bacterium]|nr:VanW family protein [Lachnospiraceae bacterium]
MKNWFMKSGVMAFACAIFLGAGMTAQAQEEQIIKAGIYIGDIDVGGMTEAEAIEAVEAYVEELRPTVITLEAANDGEVQITAGDLGITWVNQDVVKEAANIGQVGNVITRYKIMKDLQHDNIHYDLEFSYDINAINDILVEQCVVFDSRAVDAELTRVNGAFQVQEGKSGYMLDVERSIDTVYEYMVGEWNQEAAGIALVVNEEAPKGNAEELAQVQDVLGTYTTSFKSSGKSRSANIENGTRLITGTTLYPGEEFSTLEKITPFTEANGYYMAGSYSNGKVVDSLGGGICQVSTTLYNAVLLAELDVTKRYNHSMIVSYVDPSADAAIAESAGKDFKFVNNTDAPIYVEGIVENKKLTINIYGKETRDPSREVLFESEILEKINPGADVIYVDASREIGYIQKESAHIGYKARLWKIVKENGVEVERSQVNSSSYKMTPRYATVGVSTADLNAYNEIMAAIGTSSIDHVQNVIAILTAPPVAPTQEVPVQ